MELDGFRVCLVISGQHVRSGRWLPLIFDSDWPAMETAKQRQLVSLPLCRCLIAQPFNVGVGAHIGGRIAFLGRGDGYNCLSLG